MLQGTTESIDSITFSFLTDEEVRNHSFVKISNPRLLDLVERPIPGGLYDPALGPLSERTTYAFTTFVHEKCTYASVA